jgi:hypothetical protein
LQERFGLSLEELARRPGAARLGERRLGLIRRSGDIHQQVRRVLPAHADEVSGAVGAPTPTPRLNWRRRSP